jgi:hypothetical protein
MRKLLLLYFFILGLFFAISSCKNSTEPALSSVSLVPNPSFESNGVPSLSGWTISDSMSVRLVEDSPSGGGRWSLRLDASAFPGSYAHIKVPAEQGNHQYRFSLWCKKAGVTSGAAGIFFLPHDTTMDYFLTFSLCTIQFGRSILLLTR